MKPLHLTPFLAAAMLAFNLAAQTNNTREITVRVQDDSGQPIAGVTLECYTYRSDMWGGRGNYRKEEQLSAITSDSGLAKLTVPLEIVDILGRKPGMAFGHVGCGIHENSVALTLHKPDVIAGVVVDEADKPVADAEVSIAMISFGRLSHGFYNGELLSNYLSARTGSDGSFRIEGCPAGSAMDLAVKKRGKALVSPPRKTLSFAQMTCRAGQQDIKLRMQPGESVTVKVVVPDKGYDMSQARVMLGNDFWQFIRPILGQPGTNGTFQFEDLAPGIYQVGARFGSNSMPEWVAKNAVVSVTNGQVANVTLEAIKGGVVEIATVSSVDGKPVGGVRITCDGEGFTDDNGRKMIRLVPGYVHSVYADGLADMNSWKIASVKEGETNRVVLGVIPPRQFSGTVRYTTGIPAAGVEVTVDTGESVKTDAAGHYQITSSPLIPAHHFNPFLVFRDRNRNLAAFRTVNKYSDVYDLQLSPASTFSGRVQDELGKPLTNAVVTLKLWNGGGTELLMDDGPLKIDAQGDFEIPTLPVSGRYSLSVKAKGYGAIEKTIESLDASRADSNTITLRLADKKIAGTVVDEKSNPVPEARISIRGDGQPQIYTESDENGRFTLDQVCAGKVTLRAMGNKFPEGTVPAEGGDTNVVLIMGRKLSQPRRMSLVGQPLPDLLWLGFVDVLHTNKPMLILLFPPFETPGRGPLARLIDQHATIKQKGLTVVGICSDFAPAAAFEAWKRFYSRPIPFPIACPTEKNDKTKWISEVEKLPWLILTDAQGRVTAEGFDLEELDAKLK